MARARSGGVREEPIAPAPQQQPQTPAEITPAPEIAAPPAEQPAAAPDAPAPAPAQPPPRPATILDEEAPPPAVPRRPSPQAEIQEPAPEAGLAPPLAERAVEDDTPPIDTSPPAAAPPIERGALSLDEERRGIQAVFEASLHAQLLEDQGRSPATVEALTGMRRRDQGFETANSETIASAAGRGPYFNTLLPEIDPHAELDEGVRSNDPGVQVLLQAQTRGWRGTARAGTLAAAAKVQVKQGSPLFALAETVKRPYTHIFRRRSPEVYGAVQRELQGMLPRDVAVRLEPRLRFHDLAVDELVTSPAMSQRLGFGSRWMMALSIANDPATTKQKGFHGLAAHILHGYGRDGLYTANEWRLLVERARKDGARQHLESRKIADGSMSMWDAYNRLYARHGEKLKAKHLEEELVGVLAERWAAGTSYGAKIDSLLERLVRLIEAIRNALQGLGFQTADDVFQKVVSGEIAQRAGGRREPTIPTYFPNTPGPAKGHVAPRPVNGPVASLPDTLLDLKRRLGMLASDEGQEALGTLRPAREQGSIYQDLADIRRLSEEALANDLRRLRGQR